MSNDFEDALGSIQTTCSKSNGRSQIFRPGSHGYLNGIRHYFDSSSQDAYLSVEPGSVEDLADIMRAISNGKVPFAVKSGGHSSNPGFSSTNGVHISMSRFNNISYDRSTEELTVGAACLFDEIYKFIRPKGYNIVGGGGSVGLSGWILGGGYSLKTNQHGLGIDNLVKVQLVLPDGHVATVTKDARSDLFWALKGGGNNFGIATEYTLKTHPQGRVYGGLLAFGKARVERVKDAIVNFIDKKHPKAAIVAAFRCYRNHGVHEFKFTVLAFYDGDKPSDDPFRDFLDIPHQGQLTTQSYARMDESMTYIHDHAPMDFATMSLFDLRPDEAASLFTSYSASNSPSSPPTVGMGVMNARARWGNVMVSKYTRKLMDVVEEEAKAARQLMERHKGKMVVADIWPFLPTMFDKRVDSAWPHNKGEPNGPLLVYFLWEDEENDKVWIDQMKIALDHIQRIALREGCTKADLPVYSNTTLAEVTPVNQIYRENLNDLSWLRAAYDPNQVMNLTGGFRIPHHLVGSYTITNVKNGAVGVGWDSGDPVLRADNMQQTVFRISGAGQDEYIISKDQVGRTAPRGNQVHIVAEELTTWKIIPESRRDNHLEYSIIKVEGNRNERWVLHSPRMGTPVLCEDGLGAGDTALWRLHKVDAA